jgi:hypothetical protein
MELDNSLSPMFRYYQQKQFDFFCALLVVYNSFSYDATNNLINFVKNHLPNCFLSGNIGKVYSIWIQLVSLLNCIKMVKR